MKEVKSPKKPLIFYYGIVLVILLVFNMFIYPLLMKTQVKEVDYGTFMKMINEKNIGEVEVADSEIIFTDKDKNTYYKTGAMDDPGLTERLYDAGECDVLWNGQEQCQGICAVNKRYPFLGCRRRG